jgi:ribosomal protein L11 methyltransferase
MPRRTRRISSRRSKIYLGKAWPALTIHVPSCDPQLQELVLAELDDFQPTAIQEPDDTSPLRAFFTSTDSRDAAARESISVADEDWAARSQAQLQAITIGRLVVAPPWDMGSDALLTIIVKPSMGFGTGHHATTRLALKALQELSLENQTMLDIGCGSGVLAIAAVLLGARSAVGVEIDPDALDNARENAGLNNMGDRVRFEEGDFREMSLRATVVTANLTGALLERSAAKLADLVAPGGFLIVSGFMESEKATVMPALDQVMTLQGIAEEDEWVCGTYRSRQM